MEVRCCLRWTVWSDQLYGKYLIYVFFGESWGSAKGVAADMIYKTILAVIATNGIPEAIVAALITTAVGKVLLKFIKK